jgi:tetratricopeptide (TPR) repeat protein
MTLTSKSINSITWKHGAVLLMGMLVFVLLLIADKTNLDDEKGAALGGRAGDGGKSESTDTPKTEGLMTDLMALLPADESPTTVAQLRTALEAEQNADARVKLYHDVVEAYSGTGRSDLAAIYAAALAAEVPKAQNFIVAGALFRNASALPHVLADTNLFRRFSNEAIHNDESAIELEPANEDAKLELGLALVESRIPGNSMNGIFKIREVAEQNPGNTEALFHLGKFSLDTNQDEKAAQRFKQILAIAPTDARAKYNLGIAEQRLGHSAEFKRLMSEVAIQTQDPNLAALAQEALSKNP